MKLKQDEARVRQKGRTGYVWWQRGHTPQRAARYRLVRGNQDENAFSPDRRATIGHESAWIIGAICPVRDTGVALVRTALCCTAGDLVVPENLSLVFLPPYSPELNPIERLWLHLRDNRLSHCVFQTTGEIVDTCCDAWNWLLDQTGRVRSLCSYPWLEAVSN